MDHEKFDILFEKGIFLIIDRNIENARELAENIITFNGECIEKYSERKIETYCKKYYLITPNLYLKESLEGIRPDRVIIGEKINLDNDLILNKKFKEKLKQIDMNFKGIKFNIKNIDIDQI